MRAAVVAISKEDLDGLKSALGSIEDINAGVVVKSKQLSSDLPKTLLYLATEQKNPIPLCRVLLEKGADPNRLCSSGLAPIHLSACNFELFQIFLDNGGEITCQDSHQKTPIFYAIDNNKIDVVKFILQTEGTGDARCNDKRTPLHDSAERGFCDIALELLNKKADVNAQNWNGVMPLHLATCYGRFDMVELLIDNGAAIDAQDNRGWTPLHYAAFNGHADIAKFLISSGCDHMLINAETQKAPDVAKTPDLSKELTDFIISHLLNKSRGIEVSASNFGICVFCQGKQAEYDFTPCHHVSLCQTCYDENKERLKFCPMCRKTLKAVQRVKHEE